MHPLWAGRGGEREKMFTEDHQREQDQEKEDFLLEMYQQIT